MASINRDNLVNHMHVSARFCREAAKQCGETPRIAEQFIKQAEEAEAFCAALDRGEPVTVTGD